ncbi:unnamed protein product [Alopecurus aequalis]
MDFHALPRRDLQALCKRNGIRANMTNVAMADALAALPAVVDEIDKEAAAEEGEMQGISLPGAHGVALTPHEVIILDESEEEDKDLMPNQDEEKAPALGVGRRRASRRARLEPVASPATRKRAAASMAETAAETVPARTTRARSQRMVVSAPEEEAPKTRRTPRRAVARKTSMEQEEEGKGTQGDISDECMVDLSVQERQPDVQQCEDSPIFRNDTVSNEKIHDATEDTEMLPVNELPLATLKSGEVGEEVDLTSGAGEKNEIPTSCEMLQSSGKAIEKKEDMAADEMTNNTNMSAEEEAVVVTDEMRPAAVEDEEKEPALGVGRRRASRRAWVKPLAAPATRKRAAASMAETAADTMPARTTRARSQMMVVSAPEEEAPKARRTPRRSVARKTGTEQEEEDKGTHGDVSDECVVDSSVQELHPHVQRCEDSPILWNDTISSEEIHHANEDTEMGPVKELPLATLKSGEAAEEVDFASGASEENEIPTSDMSAEEEAVVATDEMAQRSATVEEGVIEVVTVDNLSQATVTDDEGLFKESGFTADQTDVSIEEDAAVATDEMALSLATMNESVKEDVVPVDYLSQATVTDDEGAVKESGFSCDPTGVSVEKKGVVADGIPQSLATPDESVEQVVTIDNLSQATLTDDEGTIKESGFNCDLADVSVEEDGVVTADEMSQRSATLDESVKEEVATTENLSQATVTDDEWVVKESAFTGDLPLVVDTARGFSDYIASPLCAGMLEIATKSMSIDSITVEPMVSEADGVPLRMHSNSGGQKSVAEPVAVEPEKEGKECEASGSLSLRKLRIKLKEKVAVEREKGGKECEALGSLSLRKLRIKLKEKLVVAQENEADDVPPCMCSSIGGEKNTSEPVAVEREEEMKEGKESEALGSLSLRKLRTKLNEKVTVAQENEVKKGKETMALDKLSLRKLKMKFKETLNVQKVTISSHPSM